MFARKTDFTAMLLVGLFLSSALCPFSEASPTYRRVYDARAGRYVYVENTTQSRARSVARDPIVKQAAIGAALGAGAGALTDKSTVLRGAGIGVLTGAGSGLIDSSRSLEGKPLVKSGLKGAVIGTGASAVTRNNKLKGAAIGGAAGAGVHVIRDYLGQ
jgi:hypothetical protein